MIRPAELIAARRRGELDRDAYWAAMREHHLVLDDYRELVASAGLASLEITPAGLRVRFVDGPRIAWDPAELRSPAAVLLNDGTYEDTEWTVIRGLGTGARTVLDIGANIGWYTIRLAAARGDRPGVHAFEPLPSTHRQLAENVDINGFGSRVAVHTIGLGERNEVVPFYVPSETGSVAASLRPLFEKEQQVIVECQVRRLDDIADELALGDIDFIKCDIEGGEFGFLRGAASVLAHQRPTVLLEMLRKWSAAFGYHPNDIIDWMRSRGYVCGALTNRSLARIHEVTDDTSATNYLFVPVEKIAALTAGLAPELPHVSLD